MMTDQPAQQRVYVCHGPQCSQRDVRAIWSALNSAVQQQGLAERCELIVSGCLGRCDHGPNMNVYPRLTKYSQLTPENVRRIVVEHLQGGAPVQAYRYEERW
jgi:NADH-quinone oxidoreductase subunit F/NADP-reducing hydrogenase subunit HndC